MVSRDCICSPPFFFSDDTLLKSHDTTMSVSMFANALRAHSRVQVLTATRVALPASRSISSLVGFRTAVPKNVSTAVSRSFTTSQVACNDYDGGAVRSFEGSGASSPVSDTIFIANIAWGATEEDISDVFSEFGEVRSVRIRAFFFLTLSFFSFFKSCFSYELLLF